MEFMDRLTLDAPRRTNDGYLAASVRVARTGIQFYAGHEVDPDNAHGMRDKAQVRVYRAPDEVFSVDSLRSYAHRPVTVDHPPVAVTSENWRDYAVGQTDGEILRDGDFVRVPMVIMDAEAIAAVDSGKNQISQGYSCTLDWTGGTTPGGEAYDCAQVGIRANHTAIVDFARGGNKLKIGDSPMPKTILVDGHNVEMSDAAAIAVENLQRKLTNAETKVATLTTDSAAKDTKIAALTTDVATRDAEIVTLKKTVADSAITPDKLRDAAAAYGRTVSIAKALGLTVTDAMGETEIKAAVVKAKLGDAAKDWTPAQIDTSFATLAANVSAQIPTGDNASNVLRDGLTHMAPASTTLADSQKARESRFKRFENAHMGNSAKTN